MAMNVSAPGTCIVLTRADKINAFYSQTHNALFISAEVTLNPFTDTIQICRNPLQTLLPAPGVPEFMIVRLARPPTGIHPDLALNRTITDAFPMDSKPPKIAVYSFGIDNPARQEITVGDSAQQSQTPAASAQAAASAAPQTQSSQAATGPVEVTGWSRQFILQEALGDAIQKLRASAGFRNPDIGLPFTITEMGGQVGGFTLNTGVFVTVKSG